MDKTKKVFLMLITVLLAGTAITYLVYSLLDFIIKPILQEIPSDCKETFVKGHKINNLIILPAGTEITSYLEYPVLVPMVSNEIKITQNVVQPSKKINLNGYLVRAQSEKEGEKVSLKFISISNEIPQKRKLVDLYSVNVNNVFRCTPQLLVWGDKSVKEVFGRLHNMACYLIDKKDPLPDPLAKHTIVVLDGYIKADAGCEIGVKGEIESKGKEEFISLKEGSKISFVLTQPFVVDSSKRDKRENK